VSAGRFQGTACVPPRLRRKPEGGHAPAGRPEQAERERDDGRLAGQSSRWTLYTSRVPSQDELPSELARGLGSIGGGLRRGLRSWTRAWNVPELLQTRVEVSRRLVTSVARSYPERLLIRIDERAFFDNRALEVLAHEAAHIATFLKCGRNVRPHGPEWAALLARIGLAPSISCGVSWGDREGARRPELMFDHRCPICETLRTARRHVASWRCAACVEQGRDGHLRVTTRPRRNAS
jgi:predicted SprT family Zn-dependent metalloprotease